MASAYKHEGIIQMSFGRLDVLSALQCAEFNTD